MMKKLLFVFGVLGGLTFGHSASAQTVQVLINGCGTGKPVSGSNVTFVDSQGNSCTSQAGGSAGQTQIVGGSANTATPPTVNVGQFFAQNASSTNQLGSLAFCNATTAVNAVTNGFGTPLSCNTNSALRILLMNSLGTASAMSSFASAGAAVGNAGLEIQGIYLVAPPTLTNSQTVGLGTDNNGNIKSAPTNGAPIACGATTSATAGTVTTLIAAGLVQRSLTIQNNGTAAVLVSDQVLTGLTGVNSWNVPAGTQLAFNNWVPTSAIGVTSTTAVANAIFCQYN